MRRRLPLNRLSAICRQTAFHDELAALPAALYYYHRDVHTLAGVLDRVSPGERMDEYPVERKSFNDMAAFCSISGVAGYGGLPSALTR